MDLVELWVLLKTRYDKHSYNGRQLTQLQRKFPHIKYDDNELEIIIGLWYAYLGRKVTKNQAEDLSIEYHTNLVDALEEAGKVPAAMHIRNMQWREEDPTQARHIKYIEVKFRKSGTIFVTQQQTDSITL